MKTWLASFALVALIGIQIVPAVAFAQTTLPPITVTATQSQNQTSESGLVPCGGGSFLNFLDATGCNFCYLALLIQRVVNFFIMVAIPISVAMFAWAGVRFFSSGGNLKRIASAKKIFSSVLIGFIVALSAWLVVQVTLQAVTNNNFYDMRNWSALQCSQLNYLRDRDRSINDVLSFVPVQHPTTLPIGTTNPATGEGMYTDDQARIELMIQGLTVNKANCTATQTSDCTSLQGIQAATIAQVVNLSQGCGCTFIVTGGTEGGHAPGTESHANGQKIDISLGAVDTYIQNMSYIGPRAGDGAQQYKDQYGNIYAKEGNHWDITVRKVGPLTSGNPTS